MELLIALDYGSGSEVGHFRIGDRSSIREFMGAFGYGSEYSDTVVNWSNLAPCGATYRCGGVWATVMGDAQ